MFAGAAFTDAADINPDNLDAVELLSALKIIQGREDGSYDPQGNVTRAEMAKMIYVIRNGGNDDASAYETVTTTFTDISGHWAEGYIKYLQNTNIVAGKSATKFDPNGNVTTVEAMKMALVLSGYRADKANLTGAAWANNTISQATTVGMTKDVNSAMAGACTRQDAAQILYNTLLEVYAVQFSEITNSFLFDSKSGLAFNGDPITVGNKWMDLRVETGFLTAVPSSKTNPKGVTFVYDGNEDGTYSSSERVTFRNASADYTDLLGYEVKVVWDDEHKNDANAIYGIYKTANNASYSMTWDDVEQDGTNLNKVKFDGSTYELDLNDKVANSIEGMVGANLANTIAAYVDGEPVQDFTAAKFNKAALADTVTFIDFDGDGKIEAVQVHEISVAKISYVGSNNLTSKLVGPARNYKPAFEPSAKLADITVYEGIAKDDYAQVSYDYFNDKLTYEKLELQTGTIEATRTTADGTKEIRIGGNWYKASADYTDMPTALYTNDSIEYVAIDNLLYHVKKTDGAYGSKSLALIYNAADYDLGVNKGKVEVSFITREGDKKTVFVDTDKGWNGTAVPETATDMCDKIVTYRVVEGEYRFQEISATNLAGFDKAKTGAAKGYVQADKKFGDMEISDNAVVFVYDEDSYDAKVMSGKTFMDNASNNSDAFYTSFLYNDNNGFDEAMVIAVGYNTIPEVVGSTYGVLTTDAYETEEEQDGYRYFNMYVSGLGNVQAREKNGDFYTYEAGDIMRFELVSTDENNMITIKNVKKETAVTTGMITSDGIFDSDNIGLAGKRYKVDSDTIYIDMDTLDNKGVGYGDEVKAKVTGANVDDNIPNARWIVDASGKVKFLLIDSSRNEIVSGAEIHSPSADELEKLLTDAKDGQNVTVNGDVPAGTFTVKPGTSLTINNADSDTALARKANTTITLSAATEEAAAATLTLAMLDSDIAVNGEAQGDVVTVGDEAMTIAQYGEAVKAAQDKIEKAANQKKVNAAIEEIADADAVAEEALNTTKSQKCTTGEILTTEEAGVSFEVAYKSKVNYEGTPVVAKEDKKITVTEDAAQDFTAESTKVTVTVTAKAGTGATEATASKDIVITIKAFAG